MHRRRTAAPAAALAALLALAGCASAVGPDDRAAGGTAAGADVDQDGWRGTVLGDPLEVPDVVLTDDDGTRTDLAGRSAGRVTLVFPGFTSCPDVCPLTLSDVQLALSRVPAEVAGQVDVVLLTVDPARDDPAALAEYLDRFDAGAAHDWYGLTGTVEEVVAALGRLRVPPPEPQPVDDDGGYDVAHSAQVLAFGTDGVARLAYPEGTPGSAWVADLPRLVAGEAPDEPPGLAFSTLCTLGASGSAGTTTVSAAHLRPDGTLGLRLLTESDSTTLRSVSVVGAGDAVVVAGGSERPLTGLEVAGDEVYESGPGADEVLRVTGDLPPAGGTVAVTLAFDDGTDTTLDVPLTGPRGRGDC